MENNKVNKPIEEVQGIYAKQNLELAELINQLFTISHRISDTGSQMPEKPLLVQATVPFNDGHLMLLYKTAEEYAAQLYLLKEAINKLELLV